MTVQRRLALLLCSLTAVPLLGCASSIRAIQFDHKRVGELPPRPAPPKIEDGAPELPAFAQEEHRLEISALPSMQKAALGLTLEKISLPASGDGTGETLDPYHLLTLTLLRAGVSRFMPMSALGKVAATASGRTIDGLTLKASLEQLSLLGLYDRVDHLLTIRELRCDARSASFKTPRHFDAQDVERYKVQQAQYPAAAKVFLAEVDRALDALERSYNDDYERYSRQWEGRSAGAKFSDFFARTDDDRETAPDRVAGARAQLQALRSAAAQPVPTVQEMTAPGRLQPHTKEIPLYRCSVEASLQNVRSGTMLWAYRYIHEGPDVEQALKSTLTRLVQALLKNSRMPRAKETHEKSTVPIPVPDQPAGS